MYLLRTIFTDEDNKFITDNWHIFDAKEELLEMTYNIDPEDYQAFSAVEITNDIFLEVEKHMAEKEKEDKRKLLQKLKRELGE